MVVHRICDESEVEEVGQARLNVAIFEVEMERDPCDSTIGMKLKIWRLAA